MPNGIQLKEQYIAFFKSWILTQSDDDFRQIIQRGQLSRTELAKIVGCNRKAFTTATKNGEGLKELLEKLESDLRKRGLLPKQTEQALKNKNKVIEYDQGRVKRSQDALRASKLENEVLELKRENSYLKANLERLKRLGELDEIITDLELFPS